jgi:hypothetical protein
VCLAGRSSATSTRSVDRFALRGEGQDRGRRSGAVADVGVSDGQAVGFGARGELCTAGVGSRHHCVYLNSSQHGFGVEKELALWGFPALARLGWTPRPR